MAIKDLIKIGTSVPNASAFPTVNGLAIRVDAGNESIYIKNSNGQMVKIYTDTSNIIIDIAANTNAITTKANKTNVLELDNITAYTPTTDYHPATKKYVDTFAYTVAQTDSLLGGKLGTGGTAANSNQLGGQTLAQVQASIPTYDIDREWKIDTTQLFRMTDGYGSAGVGTVGLIPTTKQNSQGAYKNIEIRLYMNITTDVGIPTLKIGNTSAFSTWAGGQVAGANLTTWSGFKSISLPNIHSNVDVQAQAWNGLYTPLVREYTFMFTLTAADLVSVGSANGYGISIYLYSMMNPTLNMSGASGSELKRMEYRLV